MPIENVIPEKKTKKLTKTILCLLFIIIGLCVIFIRIKKIPQGSVAIVHRLNSKNLPTTTPIIQKSGILCYVNLFEDIILYPTNIQEARYDSISFFTQDGVEFIVQPRISYLLDESKVLLYHTTFNKPFEDINNEYLKELVAHSYISNGALFTSDSLVENRSLFEKNSEYFLTSKMQETGLILKNTNSNLKIPKRIKILLDLRNGAKQNALLAQERINEEYAKANLERIKDSLHYSALTNLAIQKLFIDKWDGKLNLNNHLPQVFDNIHKDLISEKK